MTARLAALAAALLPALAFAGPSVTVDPAVVPVGTVAVVRAVGPVDRLTFAGESLRFFPAGEGVAAILGVDLGHAAGRYPLRAEGPNGAAEIEVEVAARAFPEEHLTVPKTFTELDAKTLARVRREQKRLAALWPKSSRAPLWTGPFVTPADGPAGSPFGLRRFFNGEPRSPHAGIDYRAVLGSPVIAANRGRVVLASDLFFTGNTVVLDHGMGLFTLYVHLSKIETAVGRVVDKGAAIGRVGATGRVTGPHLHFAARVGEARVDPESLLGRPLE